MESIEQNPVYYDLAFEMPLHKDEVNIEEWLCRYADRRYGKPSENAHQAWLHLLEGPYRPGTNGTERSSIIAARPAVNVKKSGPNAGLGIPYSPLSVVQAEGLLLKDAGRLKGSDPYRFDIVDIQRQLMSNLGQAIHKQAAEAFRKKDKEAFALHSNRFLEMLRDADELLRTRPEFNFDKWLTQARSWGDNSEEKDLFEKDATALVTVWGADGDPLIFDYSWREWTGLIDGYYLKRWEKFYAMLQDHLDAGTNYSEKDLPQTHGRESFRANDFYNGLAEWELAYVDSYGKARTPVAEGDEVAMVKRLFDKYLKLSQEYYAGGVKVTEKSSGERTYENLGEE